MNDNQNNQNNQNIRNQANQIIRDMQNRGNLKIAKEAETPKMYQDFIVNKQIQVIHQILAPEGYKQCCKNLMKRQLKNMLDWLKEGRAEHVFTCLRCGEKTKVTLQPMLYAYLEYYGRNGKVGELKEEKG